MFSDTLVVRDGIVVRFGSSKNVKVLLMATWVKYNLCLSMILGPNSVSHAPINKQRSVRPHLDPVWVLELYLPIQKILFILSTVEVLD
jgi:hypothetical protein